MPYIPNTPDDVSYMLSALGVTDIEELFSEIPETVRLAEIEGLGSGLNESDMAAFMKQRARNDEGRICFTGAGAYDHYIPAPIGHLLQRGEFYSAYTPYQAEASQGTLQIIYEFQTLISRLMAMPIANASLYDGASALAEAVLMVVRSSHGKKRTCLVPESLHPFYRQTLTSIVGQQDIHCVSVPFDEKTGLLNPDVLHHYAEDDACALIIGQPNGFGHLEAVDDLTDQAHKLGMAVIGVVNPLAMSVIKPPGQWGSAGADIACGDGQPLGLPLSSGGPYFGFLCAQKPYLRQIPGRIVGRTHDAEGRNGFVLTLQAREQHIRRARATSNICTNQGLMLMAATFYMALMGSEGMEKTMAASHIHTHDLRQRLCSIVGVEPVFDSPYMYETLIRLPIAPAPVLEALAAQNIEGGWNVEPFHPQLGHVILVCATEMRTHDHIERYHAALAALLNP